MKVPRPRDGGWSSEQRFQGRMKVPAPPGRGLERSLELFQTIARQFDKEALRDLCFSLGVDYDDLPAEGKTNVARELVRAMARRGRLAELEQAVEQVQPAGRWFPGRQAEERQARLRNRRRMVERVRRSWVQGVLEQSLYHVARIDLGLQDQPEAVERPWAMIVQEQGQPPRPLTMGARMSQIFDELGGALLILGAPGTGKTTLLPRGMSARPLPGAGKCGR